MIKIDLAAVAAGFVTKWLLDKYGEYKEKKRERERIKEFYTPEVMQAFSDANQYTFWKKKHDQEILEAMRVPEKYLSNQNKGSGCQR